MLSAVEFVHALLRDRVSRGGAVLDGTVGNGHDLILLAALAGPEGRVFGFEIQEEALTAAAARLEELATGPTVTGPQASCVLFPVSHAELETRLPAEIRGRLEAAVFNLGYLPGGDKSVRTRPESTLPALRASLEFLAPGGVLAVTVYPGHEGGLEEARAVRDWAAALDSAAWHVAEFRSLNARRPAPAVLVVQRRLRRSGADPAAAGPEE